MILRVIFCTPCLSRLLCCATLVQALPAAPRFCRLRHAFAGSPCCATLLQALPAASPATMDVLPFCTGFARCDIPISRRLAAQYIVNIVCQIAAAYVCNRIALPRDVVGVRELIT